MADPLREYRVGEFLQAATVNAHSRFQKRFTPFSDPQTGGSKSSTVVLMRNDGGSGEDVDRYGILGIDGVVIERDDNEIEFDNRILLSGVMPEGSSSSSTGHTGKFAVAQMPIAAGDIGQVVIAGATQVQINVTDEDHQFADVKDGDNTQLESANYGAARIIAKQTGTGTKWAVVLIGPIGGIQGLRISPDESHVQVTFDGVNWVDELPLHECE